MADGPKGWPKKTTACQEVTKTEPNPGMMQSIEEHQEIPKGEAEVHRHLNITLPQCWTGHMSRCNKDSTLTPLPPRSSDLTPCDFFLWGYVKEKVYAHPIPRDLPEFRQRIVATADTINVDMLKHM
jgi:hypothetical protein